MARGLTSQVVADRLYVSRRAVETHVSRVFRKTGPPHVPPWPR
ncbi:LuxR C-terminal-related transcriptional regulator [Streptomyces canus]|nr:LuxR C-terminal-related transcriptional regulator [Streptomyces canus]